MRCADSRLLTGSFRSVEFRLKHTFPSVLLRLQMSMWWRGCRACLDAHSRAKMVVDIESVVELVGESIAAVTGMGLKPSKLRPWPSITEASAEKTWWHAITGK